jgi:hypothetical protein
MPGAVEVVVPLRTNGCPHREAAFRFCRERYTYPVVVVAPGGEPWIKAAAVMPAIEHSRAEVIVLADADVWCDGLDQAVAAVQDGAGWAIPHLDVVRLTEAGTAACVAGEPWQSLPTVQRPYRGIEGGGYLVALRETFLTIPLDPRFVGWGQEDHSHGIALYTLLGPAWRGTAPLIHLWHPPAPRLNRQRGSHEGWALFRRYVKARTDPNVMRALLEEARVALAAHQPPGDDHHAHRHGDEGRLRKQAA